VRAAEKLQFMMFDEIFFSESKPIRAGNQVYRHSNQTFTHPYQRSPLRTRTKPLSRYWRVLLVLRTDWSAVILWT